jgi:intracellular septation protein
MKLLFDLFPVILFFAAFKLYDIYVATGAAIVATLGQIVWLRARGKPVSKLMWLTLGVIIVFGGATLVLHDEWFIKLKPTALYWLIAGILLAGRVMFNRDLLKALLGEHLELPEVGWRLMSWMWIGFFAFMGAANLYVAQHFTTEAWVNFKVFWSMGLIFVFSIVQALVLARYLPPKESKS